MDTTYGLRGAIVPGERFKTGKDAFLFEEFEIEIEDGAIAIGFNNPADADRARDIVKEHLAWFSLKHGNRFKADLNQSWELKSNNSKAVGLCLADSLKAADDVRITTATIQGKARIISEVFDSAKLANYSALVTKSQKSPSLAKALTYFSEEVVDDERPLYGIYKALEELSHTVGGREKLAQIVSRPAKYVGDIMETAQITRHARTKALQALSDQECRERARILIEAFANKI